MGYEYASEDCENTCPSCGEDLKLTFKGRDWDDKVEFNAVRYKYGCQKCKTEFFDLYQCTYKGTVITCRGGS